MSDNLKSVIEFNYKEIEPCSYTAEFKVGKAFVDQAFSDALKEAGKHAVLPGFRKGKAPKDLVRVRYAEYIADDVEKQIQSAAFEKMSESGDVDVVSFGRMNASGKPKAGEDYSFTLDLEFAPEIKLPEYKGVKLDVPAGDTVEQIMEKRLEYLKNLYSDYVTVEEPAVAGDMLKVSYESDFVLPEDAAPTLERSVKADEAWFWLTEPEQIPGVVKALTGAVKGGEYTFAAEFPADWREAGLQGKKVNYKVKVHEAQRKVPIADETALAQKIGLETVEKMNDELKKAAEQEVEYAKKDAMKGKALEYILEKTETFPLPKGVLASTTEREFSRIAEQLVRSEKDVEEFKANKEQHLANAKKAAEEYLRKFFILRKIARNENVEVSQADVDGQIRAMSSYMGYKEDDIRKMLERNDGISEIQSEIMMSKALELIATEAKA